jgi:hypothetical protein
MHRLVSLGDDCRLGTRLQARILPADHAKDRPQPLAKFRRTLAKVLLLASAGGLTGGAHALSPSSSRGDRAGGMGAVHGVHLKYVAASALSVSAAYHVGADESRLVPWRALLLYAAFTYALFGLLFVLRWGMPLLGKSRISGLVPLWSYVVWWPFHGLTWLYTYLHTLESERRGIPVATEVAPGWWVGGRYARWMPGRRQWAATIDLTCEFPEGCMDSTTRWAER